MPNRILKFTVILLTVLDVNFGLYNHWEEKSEVEYAAQEHTLILHRNPCNNTLVQQGIWSQGVSAWNRLPLCFY